MPVFGPKLLIRDVRYHGSYRAIADLKSTSLNWRNSPKPDVC